MSDETKTRPTETVGERLIQELAALRQRVAEQEVSEAERKQVEKALRESEEKFRNLAEQSPNMIFINKRGRVVYANRRCEEMMGYTTDEFYSADFDFLTLIAPEHRELVKASFSKHTKGEDITPYEYALVTKDGRRIEAILTTKLLDYEGEKTILGTVTDISERKRAEAALQESEHFLQNLFDAIQDGLSVLDRELNVVQVNQWMEKMYAEELPLVGKKCHEVYQKRRSPCPWCPSIPAIETGEVHSEVVPYPSAEKPTGWIELSAFPVKDADDRVVNIIEYVKDITERKQAEEALRESHRRLEETLAELRATQERMIQQERLSAVGQLAAGIAHDFNNILSSIALYTQMSLRMPKVSPEIRERLEIIAEQAEYAADLVKQILDFGRRAILRQEALDMALLVKETANLLRRTLPENIKINLVRGPGEHAISADPERVQQAIVNLALNAQDAMPEGGVLRIGLDRLQIEEDQEPPLPEMEVGEWVQVTVADTGTGIPADVLPHIYEPFFTTRAPLGHGLGLAQVYGIVKQHEAHIGVETLVGKGTTFTIYWPALPVTESQLEAPAGEITDLIQGSGEIILVVENDHAMRTALIGCLEMLNFQVLEAANGQEALTAFEEHRDEISLVLSDWVMPDMGGLELVCALKQHRQDAKVLILTGYSPGREIKDTAQEDIVGWVQKPPQIEQLAAAIARALGTDR